MVLEDAVAPLAAAGSALVGRQRGDLGKALREAALIVEEGVLVEEGGVRTVRREHEEPGRRRFEDDPVGAAARVVDQDISVLQERRQLLARNRIAERRVAAKAELVDERLELRTVVAL